MQKKSLGLDLEEVRSLLMEKHQIPVEDNDPMLMEVTIFNAFVEEYNRLLKVHHMAMKKTMTKIIGEHGAKVEELANSLMKDAVRTTIENTVTEISMHKVAMDSFLADLKKYAWLNSACAVICILALVGVLIFGGLR